MVAKLAVTGAEETAAAFGKVSDDVRDMTATHTKVARARLGGVAALSPVLTGALAGSWQGSGSPTAASISSPLAYAAVHEYGSERRGISATAMVRRTLEAEQGALLEEYRTGILETAKRRGFRVA